MATVLAVAGFDPSAGAGVTADLAVFAAHRLFGTACVTALTVQSTVGVVSTHPVAGEVVSATLDCLEEDLPAAGIKIGMLGSEAGVRAVAEFLEGLHRVGRRPVVVLDPVARSSSGRELLGGAGLELLRWRLLPLVDWVTPNLAELASLCGTEPVEQTRVGIGEAARAFGREMPGLGVLGTCGDLDPPDDLLVLPGGGGEWWLAGEHVATTTTHGTGCALSSAFLCRLVLGEEPVQAARGAKEYVAEAIRRGVPRGRGRGPMEHLWPLRDGGRGQSTSP